MTEPQVQWIDWPNFKAVYEASSELPYASFNTQLRPLASAPLHQLLVTVGTNLKSLTLAPAHLGLKIDLGAAKEAATTLWTASAGLSPKTARLGLPRLNGSTPKVNSFIEGLNIWLEIPNQQNGQLFRSALMQEGNVNILLDVLLQASKNASIQLTVGSNVSYDNSLWANYKSIAEQKERHSSPFKNTQINSDNRVLIETILHLYAEKVGEQTIMLINFSLAPDVIAQSPPQLVGILQKVMTDVDNVATLITRLSRTAPPIPGEIKPVDPEPSVIESAVVSQLLNLTRFTRNIILYGPPGTGKTYAVQQFQDAFLGEQSVGGTEPVDVGRLPRWQAIALTLYGSPEPLSVTAMLEEQPLARYEAIRAAKTPYASVMTELVEHGVDESDVPVSMKYKRNPTVFQKQPNKTWTLTAEGRALVEKTLLGQPTAEWSLAPEARSRFITFHPSFAYEEFVEGLRPETDEEGRLQYRVRPGQFKEICQDAEKELREAAQAGRPPRKFLLVIDEINRANIAKVFGELMTLIEDGKRVDNAGGGLCVQLPYSGQPFGVPENLTILGTMNTADRSIALLDLALRRRFTFLEVLPDAEVIRQTSGTGGVVDGIDVAALLEALNARLRVMLDRDHQMGHSYLSDIQGGLDELHYRWYRKVIPLLQEYFYNDGEKLARVLGSAFVQLGERVGGVGGRLDYDILPLAGEPFKQALQALSIPSAMPSGAALSQ